MIDLTPLDVRKKRGDFRRILRGYDPEEVDTFLDLVAERFEELVRENLSLSERTQRLEGQVVAMEGREKAIQEALVSAQKLREEVGDQSRRDAEVLRSQASRTAALLKAEAESEIARRLTEAEGLIRERQRALEDLERSRLKFLKGFRALLEREMDAVEVEEARQPLEDVALELDLRGWTAAGGSTEGAEETRAAGADGLELQSPDGDTTAEDEADAKGGGENAVPAEAGIDVSVGGEAWEADVEAAWAERAGADLAAGSGGPGGMGDLESPLDVPDEGVASESGESEEAEADRDLADTQGAELREPKWLFSLLKKEEERDGVGD